MKIEKTEKKETCCDVIPAEVIKLLEEQLVNEIHNMRVYQTFAVYFNNIGLNSLYSYYKTRAYEEFHHYSNICEFLDNNLVKYNFIEIPECKIDIKNSTDPFELTVQLELDTTDAFYEIYELAEKNHDYITMQWLMKPNGLIEEQSEEMRTSYKALEIANMNLDWISKADAIFKLL